MKGAALLVRFLLELALLAAAVATAVLLLDGWLGWLIGVAAALGVAVIWGLVLAPRARLALPTPARLALEAALFLLGGAGLAMAGSPGLGAALVVLYALDRLALWGAGAPAYEPADPSSMATTGPDRDQGR